MSKTYQPKKKKRANTHGFLRRKKTKTGRQVLQARRRKGRAKISVQSDNYFDVSKKQQNKKEKGF